MRACAGTIFLVVTNMAVVRGSVFRSSSAFRVGCGTALLYSATLWPGMVSAVTLFWKYNLFTADGCRTFIGGTKAQWGFPDDHELLNYCQATQLVSCWPLTS